MKNFKRELWQSAKVLIMALVLSVGVQHAFAWTGPTSAPPGGNTSAPINISGTAQTKSGGITAGSLGVTGTAHFTGVGTDTWFPYSNGWNYLRGPTNLSGILYDEQNNGYQLDLNGTNRMNYINADRVDTPITYDSNNTGYYVDPSGTSRMNQLYYVDQAYIVDVRPQYMYDWNDTTYYMDFNNASVLNVLYANAFYYRSDQSLKHNIKTIPNALDNVLKLRGVEFNWKKDGKKSVGVVAQEVEKVYPELVSTDKETGLKSVEYGNLVGPLIEAVKEQQKEIEKLRKEVNELKEK
jgi:hypothetical protein